MRGQWAVMSSLRRFHTKGPVDAFQPALASVIGMRMAAAAAGASSARRGSTHGPEDFGVATLATSTTVPLTVLIATRRDLRGLKVARHVS